MEPRKTESSRIPEHGREEPKCRFRIVKLEERVAPRRGDCGYYCYSNHGWDKHGWSGPPGQNR